MYVYNRREMIENVCISGEEEKEKVCIRSVKGRKWILQEGEILEEGEEERKEV